MTKGWVPRRKARGWMRNKEDRAKNPDLCSRHRVSFHWIKGHNNHPENDSVTDSFFGNLFLTEVPQYFLEKTG